MSKKRRFIGLALVNTILLFLLTTWFWSLPWLAGDEKIMIWATSATKLNAQVAPSKKDYFLINVSYDQMLIEKYDEFGFPVGNQPITDRHKISRLLQIINQSKVKPDYVFLDIFFEEPTSVDSILAQEFNQLEKSIVSVHLDENKNLTLPIIQTTRIGLSDYELGSFSEGIYKFQLFSNDTLRLTPLIIHQQLNGYTASKLGPFVKTNKGYTLNHFILNYRLLQKDIVSQEEGFNPVNLGELLVLPDEDVAEFLKDKIVIVGDFYENDMHETLFEITSGPVILLNAFLAIDAHDTVVNIWFILIITFFYFGVSFVAIYPEDLLENYIRRKYGKIKWVGNLTSFMSYLIILSTASILCYFLFNIHINAFFLSVYLFIIEKGSDLFFGKKLKKSTLGVGQVS